MIHSVDSVLFYESDMFNELFTLFWFSSMNRTCLMNDSLCWLVFFMNRTCLMNCSLCFGFSSMNRTCLMNDSLCWLGSFLWIDMFNEWFTVDSVLFYESDMFNEWFTVDSVLFYESECLMKIHSVDSVLFYECDMFNVWLTRFFSMNWTCLMN